MACAGAPASTARKQIDSLHSPIQSCIRAEPTDPLVRRTGNRPLTFTRCSNTATLPLVGGRCIDGAPERHRKSAIGGQASLEMGSLSAEFLDHVADLADRLSSRKRSGGVNEEQASKLVAKRTAIKLARATTGDDVIDAMPVGRSSPLRGPETLVEMRRDLRIEQRLTRVRPQLGEGFGNRYRYSVVEQRPNPFDVIASVPTEVVRHVD